MATAIVMLFLNYHSTLLRDLLDNKCTISSKAGVFYRDYWPWLKAAAGVYM